MSRCEGNVAWARLLYCYENASQHFSVIMWKGYVHTIMKVLPNYEGHGRLSND